MNNKIILDYVWLDGDKTQNARSKIKVLDWDTKALKDNPLSIKDIPVWNFDGSSTKQAKGNESECILRPARLYKCYYNQYIVLCEVLDAKGNPHKSNTRNKLASRQILEKMENTFWWGFEQEYFMFEEGRPSGWPASGYPKPQGGFYCAAGHGNVVHRDIALKHMYECLNIGIDITGVNAEVALGQWEYQCFGKDTLKACDDLCVSRYILQKLAEKYDISIELEPKPIEGDWNGSGCHTNFSNYKMRNDNDKSYFIKYLANLEASHDYHVSNYGANNEKRLTGEHETQHIDKFSFGVGDRGASIRIPNSVEHNNWNGYLEDRRPSSNCDPYTVARLIIEAMP